MERMQTWLESWPGWQGEPLAAQNITATHPAALRFANRTLKARHTDVLGGVRLREARIFWLDWRLPQNGRNPQGAASQVQRVQELADWITRQEVFGKIPPLDLGVCWQQVRAENGRQVEESREGWAIYRLIITVEQERVFEEEKE